MISRKADLAEKPQTAPHDLLEFCAPEFCAPGPSSCSDFWVVHSNHLQTTWRDRSSGMHSESGTDRLHSVLFGICIWRKRGLLTGNLCFGQWRLRNWRHLRQAPHRQLMIWPRERTLWYTALRPSTRCPPSRRRSIRRIFQSRKILPAAWGCCSQRPDGARRLSQSWTRLAVPSHVFHLRSNRSCGISSVTKQSAVSGGRSSLCVFEASWRS
jgi:hypothetical protein